MPCECNESILYYVKQYIGASEFGTAFDPRIITHINSTFFSLCQLGIGPKTPFRIKDGDATWSDFIPDINKFEVIKDYIGTKVGFLFDPPTSSILRGEIESQISELEWRINAQVETPNYEEGGDMPDE